MSHDIQPAVVVAAGDPALLDEIVRYLEEFPHWRLVASAGSSQELLAAVSRERPDAAIISSDLAAALNGERLPVRTIVFGRDESTALLRAAIAVGARGFVLWPKERGSVRQLVESSVAAPSARSSARAKTVALWSPKGGSGTSVIAAHLSGALAALGRPTVLFDLDLENADQTALLGAPADSKTVADIFRVIGDLRPSVFESVAFGHPAGFKAVLSPGSLGESDLVKALDLTRIVEAAADTSDFVVLDLPSSGVELATMMAERASRFLLVVTPDYLSLRRAREAVRILRSAGIDLTGVGLIFNAEGAGEIQWSDAEGVLGLKVVARLSPDASLIKVASRGELSRSVLRSLNPVARSLAGLSAQRRFASRG